MNPLNVSFTTSFTYLGISRSSKAVQFSKAYAPIFLKFFEKSITFNYEDGTSYKVSLMNDFVMVFKNGKSIGAWKYSKKNFNDS